MGKGSWGEEGAAASREKDVTFHDLNTPNNMDYPRASYGSRHLEM